MAGDYTKMNAERKEPKTMIGRAEPRNTVVEFMFITPENIDDVVLWCGGKKAGLVTIEFYSQLHGYYGKASVGHYLVKEREDPKHFRSYGPPEFEANFKEVN